MLSHVNNNERRGKHSKYNCGSQAGKAAYGPRKGSNPPPEFKSLYQILKSRQLEAAEAALAGEPGDHEGIEFVRDIYDPPYGGREFGIRDPNGYVLNFLQPANLSFLQSTRIVYGVFCCPNTFVSTGRHKQKLTRAATMVFTIPP